MIRLLDTDTINKIAAGEVIERPASVVKELVENAIDAGADRISVETEDGGLSMIRVSDNGSGIAKEDIRNAFVKHATSKISSIDDLTGVQTLGFRGEALSSIASVAKVSLLTKCADSDVGYSYTIEAGEEVSFEETGLPEGTTLVVKELFFNTPVRKKFLKSASSEGAMIASLMEHIALSSPGISFRYVNNGKEKLSTTGSGDLKEIIYSIYGRDIAGNLIEINKENDEIKIHGFIGKPAISRGNRSFENYAINGRYIKNDSVSAAIEEAYKGYIMLHNFPFTALLMDIAPELLDVNVHPAKREFRLTASESVCAFITDSLRESISGSDIVPEVTPGSQGHSPEPMEEAESESVGKSHTEFVNIPSPEPAKEAEAGGVKESDVVWGFDRFSVRGDTLSIQEETLTESVGETYEEAVDTSSDEPVDISSSEPVEGAEGVRESDIFNKAKKVFIQQEIPGVRETNRFRLLGQLFATYWLIESDDTFYMMDQHAAHEKILYERLMKKTAMKAAQTQYLTLPEVINISAETAALLEEKPEIYDCFKNLGFEVENFGDNSLKVTGIPAGLPTMDYRQMITDVLDGLCEKTQMGIAPGDNPQIIIEKIASMSCKAAIKGNDRISESEALSLIREMMDAENPFNCPHGRPTLVAMSKYEIEKKFKRIV